MVVDVYITQNDHPTYVTGLIVTFHWKFFDIEPRGKVRGHTRQVRSLT